MPTLQPITTIARTARSAVSQARHGSRRRTGPPLWIASHRKNTRTSSAGPEDPRDLDRAERDGGDRDDRRAGEPEPRDVAQVRDPQRGGPIGEQERDQRRRRRPARSTASASEPAAAAGLAGRRQAAGHERRHAGEAEEADEQDLDQDRGAIGARRRAARPREAQLRHEREPDEAARRARTPAPARRRSGRGGSRPSAASARRAGEDQRLDRHAGALRRAGSASATTWRAPRNTPARSTTAIGQTNAIRRESRQRDDDARPRSRGRARRTRPSSAASSSAGWSRPGSAHRPRLRRREPGEEVGTGARVQHVLRLTQARRACEMPHARCSNSRVWWASESIDRRQPSLERPARPLDRQVEPMGRAVHLEHRAGSRRGARRPCPSRGRGRRACRSSGPPDGRSRRRAGSRSR